MTFDEEFNESEHPRDDEGKFTAGDFEGNLRTAYKELKKRGYNPKIGARPGTTNLSRSIPASYHNGTIYINGLAKEFWSDPEGLMKKNKEIGHTSSGNPLHVIHHEMGHAKHLSRLKIFDVGEKGLIRKQVGEYATKNPSEFIAEVYAGMQGGETFSPEIMSLYHKYSVEFRK